MTAEEAPEAKAARLEAEAQLLEQIRGLVLDLADEAAGRIQAIANAKRVGAENLTAKTCVCCTFDCGDRRGHVRMVGIENSEFGAEHYDRCNCGSEWPCKEADI